MAGNMHVTIQTSYAQRQSCAASCNRATALRVSHLAFGPISDNRPDATVGSYPFEACLDPAAVCTSGVISGAQLANLHDLAERDLLEGHVLRIGHAADDELHQRVPDGSSVSEAELSVRQYRNAIAVRPLGRDHYDRIHHEHV